MIHLKVKCDRLLSVGYDPDMLLLYIEFLGKKMYVFHKVDPLIYMGLMYTDAKGAYYDKHIRDRYHAELIVGTDH